MRSGERRVVWVVVCCALLASAVYVLAEEVAPVDGTGELSLAAGAGAGVGSPFDPEPPTVPEQVGFVSWPAVSTSATEVLPEGGLVEVPPPVPVPLPVTAAAEDVSLVSGSGTAVSGPERIGVSPVSVELVSDGEAGVSGVVPGVRVSVLPGDAAVEAGVSGLVFTVEGTGVSADATAELSTVEAAGLDDFVARSEVRVTVDYAAVAAGFGADWGSRAQLVSFAPCALLGEQAPSGCGGPVVVDGFVNDQVAGTVSAVVPLSWVLPTNTADAADAADGVSEQSPATAAGPMVVAFGVSAGASGDTGNYSTTSLNPAGSWVVGEQSGSFSWSYPVSAPAPPAGAAPQVSLSYSSQAIDGLTADQNTQGGVMGPGWALSEGFIERQYRPCGADGGAGADFCWFDDNATFSFAGMSSRLVRVGTEPSGSSGWEAVTYRLEDHTGWVLKRFRGVNLGYRRGSVGSDNDREYWVAYAPDGSRYWFGYGAESGALNTATTLGSVLTVPVVGNHSGEPCHTLSNNWCHQAYRWNLDRVEDANGRVMTYHYVQDVNYYGIRGTPGWSEPYTSDAVLNKIEYGQLAATAATSGGYTNVVTFTYQWRCANTTPCTSAPNASSTRTDFPDVPVDQLCPDSYCTNYAPTFFTRRMLTRVGTWTRTAAGGLDLVGTDDVGYRWVDGDGAGSDPKRLWLYTIQHVGRSGPTDVAMPPIRMFETTTALPNRVDYNTSGGVSQMRYFRVGSIMDEYGSQLVVAYTRPKPCPAPWPSTPPAGWTNFTANTWSCFPRWWSPPSGPGGFAIWHRYVVDSVAVYDQSGTERAVAKSYDYSYPQLAIKPQRPAQAAFLTGG